AQGRATRRRVRDLDHAPAPRRCRRGQRWPRRPRARAPGRMRKLALGLAVAACALIVAMLVVTLATGVTQEQYEYVTAHYAFEHAGATRVLFAIDLAFLVTYTWMFVTFASYLTSRGASRLLAGVALGAMVVTAGLDIVEDHHILSLLALTEAGGQPSDGMLTF